MPPPSTVRLCRCGCGQEWKRGTENRHLQGKGTVATLVARAKNAALRRVQRLGRSRRDHSLHAEDDAADSSGSATASLQFEAAPDDFREVPMGVPVEEDEGQAIAGPAGRFAATLDEEFDDEDISASEAGLLDAQGDGLGLQNGIISSTEDQYEDQYEQEAEKDEHSWQQGLTAGEILEEEFEREAVERGMGLSTDDMQTIRAHNYKVAVNLGANAYEKLPRAFPELADLLSLQRLQTRVASLSGLKPVNYDCCQNSCCCFTGSYSDLDTCPYCDAPRRNAAGRPVNRFSYLPLIPRLLSMFLEKDTVSKMDYRNSYPHGQGPAEDVFDGSCYLRLLRKHVEVGGETLPHCFFSEPTDIAMGLSTDGFCPFKRRKQTCWPIIGFNYNLPPEIRFQLANIICFGVIPGPKQPKDMDSFYVPLVDELIKLARGVAAFDALHSRRFALHVYLLLVFGDMPAIAKLMRMKGHNGLSPCRACRITGIRDTSRPKVTTHYTPLHRDDGPSYDPLNLPRRNHDEFINQALLVEEAPTEAEADRRAKQYGIKGVPILASLSSLSFPDSFPHDFMHAGIENVLKMLVDLWAGDYKGLDTGCEDYKISPSVWEAIGEACTQSGNTIPSAFGCRVPNISSDRHCFIAESWLLFGTLLGPVLLRQRFSRPTYYRHFIKLIKLFNLCLQLSVSGEDIKAIEVGFAEWVEEFERLYYQYNTSRLPVCTLPIHSLLHIADDIRRMGPVWCYWAFPMERFCGSLLPAIKSRRYPYTSIALRVRDIAQLGQIKLAYGLSDELDLSDKRAADKSAWVVDTTAPEHKVLYPQQVFKPEPNLRKKIAAYLATNNDITHAAALRTLPEHMVQWGKLRLVGKDVTVHAKDVVSSVPVESKRDATFLKYFASIDKNRRRRNAPPEMTTQTFYGQLLRVIELALPSTFPCEALALHTILLALVAPAQLCSKNELDMPYFKDGRLGTPIIISAADIDDVVGRVLDRGLWAIVQRTGALSVDNVGELLVDGADA